MNKGTNKTRPYLNEVVKLVILPVRHQAVKRCVWCGHGHKSKHNDEKHARDVPLFAQPPTAVPGVELTDQVPWEGECHLLCICG